MKKPLLLIFVFISIKFLYSQNNSISPLEIAKIILDEKNNDKEKGKFYYENRKVILDYKSKETFDYNLSFKEFPIIENYTIINVTAKSNDSKLAFDFYLYFVKKDNSWKLFDARKNKVAFYYPSIAIKMSEKQADSILQSKNENKFFYDKKQFNFMKKIYEIGYNSDENVIKYFVQNKNKFENLKVKFIDFTKKKKDYKDYEKNKYVSEINNYDLPISEITEFYPNTKNTISFIISKLEKDAVGFFYTENKDNLTLPNPNGIFFIRPIDKNWYFFKSN